MTHAWCQDVSRDAAVRAAEDGRDRPLPTLKEAIAAVPHPLPPRVVGTHWADWEELREERDAAIREREELQKQVVAIKEQSHDRWRSMNNALCELSKVRSERDSLQARVAELEAASGGGEHKVTEGDCLATVRDEGGRAMPKGPAPGLVAKQAASGGGKGEPVAWRVEYRGFIELYSVEQFATERASEVRGTVVPLYRSPPQPRGWLTEEESDALFRIVADEWPPQANGVRDSIIRSLLARSTPPKVVKPDRWRDDIYDGDRIVVGDQRDAEWLAALAAAGVEVKEVGRE